jgi:hypothetical protein
MNSESRAESLKAEEDNYHTAGNLPAGDGSDRDSLEGVIEA